MNGSERNELALELANIASQAGKLIMEKRSSGVNVYLKSDQSPVTSADTQAELLIRARLAALLADVTIIAEESFDTACAQPTPDRFVLVDPLDGTREFVAGRDEFTVNIALVDGNEPIVGAIYAPALGDLYLAGTVAYQGEVEPGACIGSLSTLTVISASTVPDSGMRAVGSRSHMDARTEQWLSDFPISELRSAGSSLKFCLIARGDADVYPRMGPTMEWDTAAGHAILNAAGGCILNMDGTPLHYGKSKEGYKNGGYVAWGRKPVQCARQP